MCDHAAGFPISEELGASLAESAGLREQVMAQIGLDRGERGWGGGRSAPFFDPDGRNDITEKRQYVFTEWDPTAKDDLDALRSVFDSDGDGKLTAADADFAKFKVMVTNADGSTSVTTLAALGITEIDLAADTTRIELSDGSTITGQATFTKSDGSTGTVANTMLVAEAQGYRVVQTEAVDGAGNRVVTTTAYGADGAVAYGFTSVTSPSGDDIANSYDDDGDGVVDRLQTIVTVTNPDGSETETLTNLAGAVAATALLVNRTVTTTSSDGATLTIERDTSGGGWFDQREVRVTLGDGSRTKLVSDLAEDGSVIRSSSETISADGLVRSEATDADGDGLADTVTSDAIAELAGGERIETVTLSNRDGSLRSSSTETESADGRTRSVAQDLDGDGNVDRTKSTVITVNAGGDTSSTATVLNGDGSVRSSATQSQSADALTRTRATDADGDGNADLTVIEATVINGDGSRVKTVTETNRDGSVRGMEMTTLGADKVTTETWEDLNQNGAFEATDLVRSVVVDTTTQARTTTVWERNADGSVNAQSVSVTSADGLDRQTVVDADGDGDTDTELSDVTVLNGNGTSTRSVEERNEDGSLRSATTITSSADGLTAVTATDREGDGVIDGNRVDARVQNGDGSITRTVSDYAGDGATLLAERVVTESADRLTVTESFDQNGDGQRDLERVSVEAPDGSKIVTETRYHPDGTVAARSVSTVSANGLVRSTQTDSDGDGLFETRSDDTTVLNADGSRTRSVAVENGDGNDRSLSTTTISDDGLSQSVGTDADGDGIFERVQTRVKTLAADGSATEVAEVKASGGAVLSRQSTTVSDDGLVTTTGQDGDGDGDFDLTEEIATTLLADGGTATVSELREASGALRSRSTVAVSDDGRQITEQRDVNGDGNADLLITRTEADDGTVTTTMTDLTAAGHAQGRVETIVSANGLVTESARDVDGDGVTDLVRKEETVLNSDGSSTRTIEESSSDGQVFRRSSMQVSDDGLTRIRAVDLDADGAAERTTTTQDTLTADGMRTLTSETRSANGTLIARNARTVSADQRTITEADDSDGNGVDDAVTLTTIESDGTRNSLTSFYTMSGALISTLQSTTSADGLTRKTSVDRSGDGAADFVTTDATVLGEDGTETRTIVYRDGRYVVLGAEQWFASDDGLQTSAMLDLDGDGQFELRTFEETRFAANGDVVRTATTKDSLINTLSEITLTTSGNGLDRRIESEFSGDGSVDRIEDLTRRADGAWTQTELVYGLGNNLARSRIEAVSADGRSGLVVEDLDGDGDIDRRISTEVDLSRNVETIYEDVADNGLLAASIRKYASANGTETSYAFDIDGDGVVDIRRDTEIAYATNGDVVETFVEKFMGGAEVYRAVTTTAANGLFSTTETDIDGDGTVDGTTVSETVYLPDGSRVTVTETRYADGSLRSKSTVTISADERRTLQELDYDGNGVNDKMIERVLSSDGRIVETETAFNQSGLPGQTFVTTTSADGLTQTIIRAGNAQTITRSVVDNGSYVWDNGAAATTTTASVNVSHEVDALGIESWTYVRQWVVGYSLQTTTYSARLDAEAKAEIVAQAARIYDTVLDRDMDFTEIETLVAYVANGNLDQASLAGALIASSEFATRYGTLSGAEFVTQVYLNALGRPPSLVELNDALSSLAGIGNGSGGSFSGVQNRTELAVRLAESVEKLVVGNGHMSTNNFDVIMNPAVFERSLDQAYVRSIVENLADVVFDRAPTQQELDYLTDRLLRDVDNPDDIATKLLAETVGLYGSPPPSLNGLTGAALVTQAFRNGFGRDPDADELQTWVDHLASGRITVAQFIASLAQSVEHLAEGNTQSPAPAPSITTITGTTGSDSALSGTWGQDEIYGLAGDDTIDGSSDSDKLIGGTGNDLLKGGAGYDIYVWSTGDGNDVIDDISAVLTGTDLLLLTDVASDGVTLSRANGSNNLVVTINATGEAITVKNRFSDPNSNFGIEAIEFADGVSWSLSEILANTRLDGSAAADTLNGGGYGDNIYGGDGIDRIVANGGDDILVGGTGADSLLGGAGSDTYIWSKNDGNDTIDDIALSLKENDRLVLTDVNSSGVVLSRVNGSNTLTVTITETLETINVLNQYTDAPGGTGIEIIEFSDGETWALGDLFKRTWVTGTSGADNLSSTQNDDNILGLDGNDTIDGGGGDDQLVGGLGADSLKGGSGGDRYVWSKNDGADTINDAATSLTATDVLVLVDVASSDVELRRVTGSSDLLVTIVSTSETLKVLNQFSSTIDGRGIEGIEFSDGVVWTLNDILARTKVLGSSTAENIQGTVRSDNIEGLGGNDTIEGREGDDYLVGGAGNDLLKGGAGNDMYVWSRGDGSDLIDDTANNETDFDSLVLTDVAYDDVDLTKSGDDLLISISGSSEVITVKDRLKVSALTQEAGVELIAFSDGVTLEIMKSAAATAIITGTSASEKLAGWKFIDIIYGGDGADELNGDFGDDRLIGGNGDDKLNGDEGSDTYVWTMGDGNDLIHDMSTDLSDMDTLILTDVASTGINLYRLESGDNMFVEVLATGEEIEVKNQFRESSGTRGIERIQFSDGVTWDLVDIFANTISYGTSSNNSITGMDIQENFYGLGGNDSINGMGGADLLVGGLGADTLDGGAGSDTYLWALGEGNDTIDDTAISMADVDRLVLTGVASNQVNLTRANSSNNLQVLIQPTGETILVKDRFRNPAEGRGIEEIAFGDGVIWTLADILARTELQGTSANNTLYGTGYSDNIFGAAGNDVILGKDGDDRIEGGLGDDTLKGEAGADTYTWTRGDGNDRISDAGTSLTELDRLILTDVASSDVTLTRSTATINKLLITVGGAGAGGVITVDDQFKSTNDGRGIEVIEFADGAVWTLADILANTQVYGTSANDTITGTDYRDNINGLAGNDSLKGGDGNDVLEGGAGSDTLNGGNGFDTASYAQSLAAVSVNLSSGANAGGHAQGDVFQSIEGVVGSAFGDTIVGSNANNVLAGLAGDDSIAGNGGDDVIDLGAGNDLGYGDAGGDELRGGAGSDSLWGGDGEDRLFGDADDDALYGDAGFDTLDGGTGNDAVYGGAGDDVLDGGDGDDGLDGEAGNDRLIGGTGNDTLSGGATSGDIDVFVFRLGDGNDVIVDFDDGTDVIEFDIDSLDFADLQITDEVSGALVAFGSGDSILLSGISASMLAADDFLFR